MSEKKTLSPTVWVSEVAKSVKNIFPIGIGFPTDILDYPEYYALSCKKNASKWRGSTIVFTDEDESKFRQLLNKSRNMEEFYRNFEKLPVLPEKLWYGLKQTEKDRFPSERDIIFKIINGALVVTEVCAQVLQTFRLGETQFAPVRICRLDNGELLDDRLYYFLNICEQRHFFSNLLKQS